MSTLRKLFAVIATMAIALLMTPGNAFATSTAASDYPDCLEVSISISATPNPVTGGKNVTIHATATANDAPDPDGTLVIHAFGDNYGDNDNDNTIVIKAPSVTKKTVFPVSADFTPSDLCSPSESAPSATSSVTSANFVISADNDNVTPAAYLKPVTATTNVTVLPLGAGGDGNGDGNGALPNTGGTNLWYLVAGAALLAIGVAIVGTVNSRRKKFI